MRIFLNFFEVYRICFTEIILKFHNHFWRRTLTFSQNFINFLRHITSKIFFTFSKTRSPSRKKKETGEMGKSFGEYDSTGTPRISSYHPVPPFLLGYPSYWVPPNQVTTLTWYLVFGSTCSVHPRHHQVITYMVAGLVAQKSLYTNCCYVH